MEPPKQTPAYGRHRPMRLGELLVTAGVVTEADVERALGVQRLGGGRLGSILVKLKLCTDEQIRGALREQMGVDVVDLGTVKPDPSVLRLIPIDLVKKYEVIPLNLENRRLFVAMLDPYNLIAIDDIRFATGFREITVVTAGEEEFRRFIGDHLEVQSIIDEIMEGEEFYKRALTFLSSDTADEKLGKHHDVSAEQLRLESDASPIITLVNFVLLESILRNASDIHLEPYETMFRVRFRVDGRLQTVLTPPARLQPAVVTRLKVMSVLDITKTRVPQDGQLAVVCRGETVSFRISTLPTSHGEKCVLRLLRKNKTLHSLDAIGFSPEELGHVKRAFSMPQGLILVTGPTGSGKTTTVHAGLNHINEPDINIVTLEDPVETTLHGINHVPINERGGVTFASGLRSILRQDPDVVFVGEIRDAEVSQTALRAALTGHLVFSTLHTNSAVETLVRLDDMGVQGFLLAGALQLIVAQRLIRRVCERCAEPYVLRPTDADEFGLSEDMLGNENLRKAVGCGHCQNSGYKGRRAVFEILRVSPEIRELIRTGTMSEAVEEAARQNGMVPLFEAGVRIALAGETTLDEIRRTLARND